jgi:glycosyl transferase, family 25
MLFLINLDSAVERRQFMARQLASMGITFERIGIDMRLRSGEAIAVWAAAHFPQFAFDFQRLSGAEVGCWLSHLSAWNRLLAQHETQACVVIEDDLILGPDFADAIAAATSQSIHDVVYLGTSSKNLSTRRRARIDRFWVHEPVGTVYNTWGYSIARNYIRQLFERTSVNVNMPIDHFLGGTAAIAKPRIGVLRPSVLDEHPVLGSASQIAPHTMRFDRWWVVEKVRRQLLKSRFIALYYSLFRWL